MIEHIVKNNEDVTDILNMYHLELEELKEYNSHITDFKNLLAGTKLMIPLLHEEIEQILDKTEAFVMDYYPKLTEEVLPSFEESKIEEKKEEVRVEQVGNENSKEVKHEDANPIPAKPYPGILPPKTPYKGIR